MKFSSKTALAASLIIAISLLSFTACRKASDTEDTGYATDHATLEKTFSDAQSITDEAGSDGSLTNYKVVGSTNTILSSCATVTNDTTVSPHKLTVDFGTSNCLCNDGVYRRGQIIVTYLGRYKDIGSTHTITFNNYFQNDNGVSGTKTVSYTTNDAAGNPVYNISVTGQIVLANSAGTISWTSTRTRTWLSGYTTKSWSDDVYEISGNGTITRANGKTFDMLITTPLHIAMDCRWIESGVVQITPSGATARILDYGNGTCDAQANYTVNGKTYSVTLR